LDNSPFWDRGRRRTRTIRNGDKEVDEDWLVMDEHSDFDSRSNVEESDFSHILADAILKRPESIRVRARPRPEKRETEFTFPSISSFGNVDRNKEVGRRVAVERDSVQEESLLPKATISNRNGSTNAEEPHPAG